MVNVRILIPGYSKLDLKGKLTLEVLTATFKLVLLQRLREQEKGVYSVTPRWRNGRFSNQFYLDIEFETDPTNVDRLVHATLEEVKLVSRGVLDESIFLSARADVRAEILQRTNNPDFASHSWVDYISSAVRDGTYKSTSFNELALVDCLNSSDIAMFLRNLKIRNKIVFKLL